MASPKVHIKASGLLIVIYFIGFLIGFTFSWLNVLLILSFGVLIDVDHIPFGRLWKAFKRAGISGTLASWKRDGWLDADHLNFMHTWWALSAVIIFSFAIVSVWPIVAFAVHLLIDGGSLDHAAYPKCSPMPRDILLYFAIEFYPSWWLYHTEGLSDKK